MKESLWTIHERKQPTSGLSPTIPTMALSFIGLVGHFSGEHDG